MPHFVNTPTGTEQVLEACGGRDVYVVGAASVGKSTLVNLLGREIALSFAGLV